MNTRDHGESEVRDLFPRSIGWVVFTINKGYRFDVWYVPDSKHYFSVGKDLDSGRWVCVNPDSLLEEAQSQNLVSTIDQNIGNGMLNRLSIRAKDAWKRTLVAHFTRQVQAKSKN